MKTIHGSLSGTMKGFSLFRGDNQETLQVSLLWSAPSEMMGNRTKTVRQ